MFPHDGDDAAGTAGMGAGLDQVLAATGATDAHASATPAIPGRLRIGVVRGWRDVPRAFQQLERRREKHAAVGLPGLRVGRPLVVNLPATILLDQLEMPTGGVV